MENASKALIIAGAILISIMVVSLGVFIFNKMAGSAKEAANMDEQEITAFNSKIIAYVGDSISGSQVNALIQYIISVDTKAISSGDTVKRIVVTDNSSGVADGKLVSFLSDGTKLENTKKVNTGKYYKVTAEYGSNGLINKVIVTANN